MRQDQDNWSDYRIALLRQLVAEGVQQADIADRIGMSYSSVRGKVRRLGLTANQSSLGNWTDARIELLTKLWASGLSASQIAERLGGVSRSSVIGKVHRLGLPGRTTTIRVASRRGNARRQRAPKPPRINPFNRTGPLAKLALLAEPLPDTPEPFIPEAERKSLMQLEDKDCRWPIGDPQMSDFHFCAKAKVPGLSYCESHARRAYQLDPPKRIGLPAGSERPTPAPSKTPAVDEFMEAMA